MKKLLLGALALSSLAVPASAAEVNINASYTAEVSCTIDPPANIELRSTGPGQALGNTTTGFTQSGNTEWTLSSVNTVNVGAQVTSGSVAVFFPQGEQLGSTDFFSGQGTYTTLVPDAQSGDINITAGLFSDTEFEGGTLYTLSATLTCIAAP